MLKAKNANRTKGSKVDGTFAVGIVLAALAISGFNVATASTDPAPVQTSIEQVVTSGNAGADIVTHGSAGSNLGK